MNSKENVAFAKHRDQFREQAATIGQDVQELGKITKTLAEDTVGLLGTNATDYLRQGRDSAQKMEKRLEKRISEKPMQSLAIAAGCGLLLGILWRRF